jgi:hypothetical protein
MVARDRPRDGYAHEGLAAPPGRPHTDVMQQCSEPQLFVLLRCLTYAVQPAFGPPSRLCVRCGLGPAAFSWANGLPSAISFGSPWPAFDRFAGGPYSSSHSATVPPPTGFGKPKGLSVLACPGGPRFSMRAGVYDSAGPQRWSWRFRHKIDNGSLWIKFESVALADLRLGPDRGVGWRQRARREALLS